MCLPLKPHAIEREWKHAGLSCAVVQGRPAGFRCGYVRVPPGHPMFGRSYNDPDVDVHGGLTFAEFEVCNDHEDARGYWFGFDCAHAGDSSNEPGSEPSYLTSFHLEHYPKHYWTQPEVEAETERLAEQLAAMMAVQEILA